MSDCDSVRTVLFEATSWPVAEAAEHLRLCAGCRVLAEALEGDEHALHRAFSSERVPPLDLADVLARTRRPSGGPLLAPAVAMAAVLVVGWFSLGERPGRLPGSSTPALVKATANPFLGAESKGEPTPVFESVPGRLVNPFGTGESNPFRRAGAPPNPFHMASLEKNPFTPEDGDLLAGTGTDARRF